VVTGAAAGIGAAVVEAFLAEGAEVFALDRERLDISGAVPIVVDLVDSAMVAALPRRTGPIDVVFNGAGIVDHGTILDCDEDTWRWVLDVNVTTMFRVIRTFLPGMLTLGGGSIVNMASVVSSVRGVPNRLAYGTSKAAVIGLTKAVAADFVGHRIRCNAIAPGTIDTPSWRVRAAAGDDPEATRAAFVARQPMGRVGTPQEVAALAVHLASPESAFTTGAVHVIDGGMSL
jgi:2-keto-3-deoxy-L-fuconate dehydrogenase